MSTVPRRAWWWALDYAFAAKWQARSMVDWTDPRQFQTGTRRPVVIIPGVYESWQFLRPLIDDLHEAQHPVHVVTLLQHNRLPVGRAARIVADYLAEHALEDVVIVAHSKGGLIGKYVMTQFDAHCRIAGMVAIASPFSGSRYARFMLLPTLRTFSPSDATTVRLARALEVNARITSVFASFDPHIPEGSVLPGGRNIRIPGGGHFRVIAHPQARKAVRVAVGEA